MPAGTFGNPNTKASIMTLWSCQVEERHRRGRDDYNRLVHLGVSSILSILIMALVNKVLIIQTASGSSVGRGPILLW